MKSYTYRITCIPTGQHYYGVRTANNTNPEEDLWTTYFTSSKLVHKLIQQHGPEQFIVEIRKVFVCAEAAKQWEHKVLTKLKVKSNPMWLNQAVGNKIATNRNKSRTNGKANKGRKHKNTGHQLTRPKLQSEITWIHHPNTNKEIQAQPSWINYYLSLGYVKGRKPNLYSESWKQARSERYQGSGNPSFGSSRPDLAAYNKGRRWITNGVINKRIPREETPAWLEQGFWIGRT